MVNDAFLLYLLTRVWAVDMVATTTTAIAFLLALVSGTIFLLAYTDGNSAVAGAARRVLRGSTWVAGIALVVALILPGKQDTLLILAGTGVLAAAKSETVQGIASKSVAVIEKFLDEQLREKK